MTRAHAEAPQLQRVLIANRGEIAIRIAKAASGLGMESVGVFATVDSLALHTRFTTLAVELGGKVPVAAYLDGEALVRAAALHGCDCVHPGYGFLAENAEFAELCAAEGLVFVGPRPATLRLFGDKVRARAFAESIGIGVVPGSAGPVASAEEALAIAQRPRLSDDAQGFGGGRWARHAARRCVRRDGRSLRAVPQRSGGLVRRRIGLPRARDRSAAAHRGAGPGRLARQCRASARARLLGATAQPEGDRDRARAAPRPEAPRSDARRCDPVRARRRVRERGHHGVPGRARDRRALLHRVQPAHPGRAHGHRAGDGCRPGRGAVPHRVRRVARCRMGLGDQQAIGRAARLTRYRRASSRGAPARSPRTRSRAVRACGSTPAATWVTHRRRSSIRCWRR